MRSSWFAALVVGAVLVSGCEDDPSVIVAPDSPRAVVRYINAVPDTVATDWRFIDQLAGSPVELALGFRGVGPYQAAAPGSRPLRVFPATTDLSTQFFFVDQAVQLDANKRYTLALVGMARAAETAADKDRLLAMEDVVPDVPAAKIAIRAMHFGTGIGNVDVYVSKAGGTTALPATPQWSNLAFLATTPYVMVDPAPKTGVTGLGAIVGGYSRETGSFATDGFTVGQQITAAGFTPSGNSGRSIINAIIPRKTTGAASLAATATGFTRTTGDFVADGFTVGMFITVTGFPTPGNNGRFLITAVTPTTLTVGTTTGSTTLGATASTYTRSAGSFITDGFFIGMPITAIGFTLNNGVNNGPAVISNMTATVLTLAARTPPTVVEAAAAGRTISRSPALAVEAAGAGRTIASDEFIMVTKSPVNVPAAETVSQSLVGELVYRATLTGTTAVIAEWTALTGLPGDLILGQEPIGGNTMAGSALVGILMPRSVSGSSAPQTAPTTTPPTPPYTAPTFIFAIDKHPR